MAWNSPNTVIPNLPYGVSPANIPIPLTPIMPGQGQILPGQQAGGYFVHQAQPAQPMFVGQQQYLTAGHAQPQYVHAQQQVFAGGGAPQYVVPGMYAGVGGGGGMRSKLREDNPPLDKWMNGKDYGPVLDTITATLLGVQIRIHPILSHHSEQEDEGGRLTWDVLESAKDAHITEGTESKPWTGREAAATFPRLNRLYLVSQKSPGVIEVVGNGVGGCVTCLDVVNAIQGFVREKVSRSIYDNLSPAKRAKIDATYHYNRSGKGGATGRELGQGIRKGDILEEWSAFDGLEDDAEEVESALGIGRTSVSKRRSFVGDADSGAKRMKQRPWVGHLILRLEHREGEDVPFVAPEEPKPESPRTEELEDEDEEESEEEEIGKPYYVDPRVLQQMQKKGKQSRGKGKGQYPIPGVHLQAPGYVQMGGPQIVYPGGAPVVYAAPPNQGYVIQGTPQVIPGYVPAQSPAMNQYVLSPQQFAGQPPPLGTPLNRGRQFQ